MKRSWKAVIGMSILLLLNIFFTQQVVNHFFYEKYEETIVYALLNCVPFFLALWIYRKVASSHQNGRN